MLQFPIGFYMDHSTTFNKKKRFFAWSRHELYSSILFLHRNCVFGLICSFLRPIRVNLFFWITPNRKIGSIKLGRDRQRTYIISSRNYLVRKNTACCVWCATVLSIIHIFNTQNLDCVSNLVLWKNLFSSENSWKSISFSISKKHELTISSSNKPYQTGTFLRLHRYFQYHTWMLAHRHYSFNNTYAIQIKKP